QMTIHITSCPTLNQETARGVSKYPTTTLQTTQPPASYVTSSRDSAPLVPEQRTPCWWRQAARLSAGPRQGPTSEPLVATNKNPLAATLGCETPLLHSRKRSGANG